MRFAILRFLPLDKAARRSLAAPGGQLGLFGGGGGAKQEVTVKAHVAANPGGTGVHVVQEHQRKVVKAEEEDKKPAEPPKVELAPEPPKAEPAPEPAPAPEPPAVVEADEGEAAMRTPDVPVERVETAQDVSSMAVAREHLPTILAKAKELGLDVQQSPVTAEEVLYHWGTPVEEREFDPDVIKRAAKAAEGLVHLTITAPRDETAIIGTAERIDGDMPYFREFGEQGVAWSPERVAGFSFAHCADCGRAIQRKFAYIVRDPNGHIRQIGGQCADNLDLPGKFKRMMSAFEELANVIRGFGGDDDEGMGGGRVNENLVDPVAMFRVALATLEARGFHSAKAYWQAQREGADKMPPTPTSWSVTSYFETQKDIAKGRKVSKEAREEYERIRASLPRIAPLARTLHEQALAEAEAKAAAPGATAMDANSVTALKTGAKKLAGFSTWAAWKQLKAWKAAQATHPPKPYVRETIAEKAALPIEELRAALGEKTVAAIEKSRATGKPLTKTAQQALEGFVPGVWRVEDSRSFDGQFGTTHKIRLRRDADGAGIEWSTSSPTGRVHGTETDDDKLRAAREAYEDMGLPTRVEEMSRLGMGDVVRITSASDWSGPRNNADDDRTREEKAESAAKAAAGLQRRAVQRMTRLNVVKTLPAWSPEQQAVADRYAAAAHAYVADARANGPHAVNLFDAKAHNEREAWTKATTEAVDKSPEVKALREQYAKHFDDHVRVSELYSSAAWAKRDTAKRAVDLAAQFPRFEDYHKPVEGRSWGPRGSEAQARTDWERIRADGEAAARELPELDRDYNEKHAAHQAVVAESNAMHAKLREAEAAVKQAVGPEPEYPLARPERRAIVEHVASQKEAFSKRAAEHAKRIESLREEAVQVGVYPHHLDQYVLHTLHAGGTMKKGTRFLVRWLVKGDQINLFSGKAETGKGTKRVRVKAHTRIVNGKAEVVQAHEREVEIPAKPLPGPLPKAPPNEAFEAAQKHAQTCRSCKSPITDEAGNVGSFSEACPEGVKLLARYAGSLGYPVPAVARRAAEGDGDDKAAWQENLTKFTRLFRQPNRSHYVRLEEAHRYLNKLRELAPRLEQEDAIRELEREIRASEEAYRNAGDAEKHKGGRDASIGKPLHVGATVVPSRAYLDRQPTVGGIGRPATETGVIEGYDEHTGKWDVRWSGWSKDTEPTWPHDIEHAPPPPAKTERDKLIDEIRDLNAKAKAKQESLGRFDHASRGRLEHVMVDDQQLGNTRRDMATLREWRDALVEALAKQPAPRFRHGDQVRDVNGHVGTVVSDYGDDHYDAHLGDYRVLVRDENHRQLWHNEKGLTAALRKGSGLPALKPMQQPVQALPPSKRVKFRHPETGEERDGTVHGGGEKGISVLDEEDGRLHRVPHGHYVAHPDEDGPPAAKKKQAEREAAEAEAAKRPKERDPREVARERHAHEAGLGKLRAVAHELPDALRGAREDLRMGVGSRTAQAAAAALFLVQAGAPLKRVGDLKFEGKAVTCHEARAEDPALVAYLQALVAKRKPGDAVVDDAEQRAVDYLGAHLGDVEVDADTIRKLVATDRWSTAAGKLPKVKDDADHAEHVKRAAREADVKPGDVDPVVVAAHRKGVRRKKGAGIHEHLDAVHKADPNGMRGGA